MSLGSIGCLTIIVLFVLGSMVSSGGSGSGSGGADAPPPASPKEQALSQVKLDFAWSRGGFENVMMADFTITNPTPYTLKDIEITCEHSGSSGTRIDSNRRTIYEIVPAKGTKRIRNFNMGLIHSQAKSSACAITDLVVQ